MRLGIHLAVSGGLLRAVEEARALGLECLQIFAGNPRAWAQKPLDPDGAREFAAAAGEAGLKPWVAHAPYLLNLASPKEELWEKSVAALAEQLGRARMLGAAAVVVHCGSRGGQEPDWGVERVASGVRLALGRAGRGACCWLENTCGGGGQVGARLEELAALLKMLPAKRCAVVLDTAHAWAAGYDLAGAGGVERFLDQVEATVGLGRVGLWHLNDSVQPLGSRRDQHTHLGKGFLGRRCFAGLLADARLRGAAGVMETPKDSPSADARNLAFLRRLQRQIDRQASGLTQGSACASLSKLMV